MSDLPDLDIRKTISTAIIVFDMAEEESEDYGPVESEIIDRYRNHPYCNCVTLKIDDSEFFRYQLSAEVEDEKKLMEVARWLFSTMEELGATFSHTE